MIKLFGHIQIKFSPHLYLVLLWSLDYNYFNWLFIVALIARSYRDCHLLGMRNFTSSNFTANCCATSEVVHRFANNNGFRSCETLNLYICSGIWGPTWNLSLKITNSLVIFRLRKPLKTPTKLVGHGIWTQDLPNVSLMCYHGATSLGILIVLKMAIVQKILNTWLNFSEENWNTSS